MSTTMTVRLDDDVKDRLDVLAEATQRSKSFLAAEDIRAYVENNEWQIGEIRAARLVVKRVLDAVAELQGQPGLGRRGRLPGTRELSLPKPTAACGQTAVPGPAARSA
ncbi:MAG: ribbon-helix-helix protein, CopG family [Rubrivivax sp.]|nr:ribbon-helix-helix protein, CopG family [Rubrivivax sp.]